MKSLPLLLACLALVAFVNLGLDIRQRATLRAAAPLLAQIAPSPSTATDLDARLAASVDPSELRSIARTQYAKRLDAHRLTLAIMGASSQLNSAALLRGATLLVLALCALAAVLLPQRPVDEATAGLPGLQTRR